MAHEKNGGAFGRELAGETEVLGENLHQSQFYHHKSRVKMPWD
jgi:hypothetical protein